MPDFRATTPRELGVTPEGGALRVLWADGHVTKIPLAALRRACPCATCQHEREQSRSAGPESKPAGASGLSPLSVIRGPSLSELAIDRTVPVGRYAVQVIWKDGHSTGIYSFEFLRSQCPCAECRGGAATP